MADDSQFNTTFMVIDILLCVIVTAIIAISAAMVIAVIIYKKELHKIHYGFVINLMICNIITSLTLNIFNIAYYPVKSFMLPNKAWIHCGCAFAFLFIAPTASNFMVVNLTIDAFLAITYPLKYKNLMTKTKAIIMVVIAWILSATVTLPLIVSPDLDVKVDNMYLCPYNIGAYLWWVVVKMIIAITVISFNIYLYWKVFKVKQQLKCLVEVSARESSHRMQNLRAQLKGSIKSARFIIPLLIIIVVDGLLRIFLIITNIIADEYDFTNDPYYKQFINMVLWVEYINHSVVYGFMLREIYQSAFCKHNKNQTIRTS